MSLVQTQPGRRRLELSPPQWVLLGFAAIILFGSVLLALPAAAENGKGIGYLDALFTAASAVCVTGLTVVDTGGSFSTFGEIVIMLLVQLGGLGFMTFGVVVAIMLGKKLGIKERMIIQESTKSTSVQGLVRLSLGIFTIALIFEGTGFVILTLRLLPEMGADTAAYYALFHSVSAFNNAGFVLWPDNLMRFAGDPAMNVTIAALFVAGGLGFTVIMDLWRKRSWRELSLNSKIALMAAGGLIITGFLVVFGLELLNPAAYRSASWGERIWIALFQSLAPRSSGFNTIELPSLLTTTQFFLIILMFIGANSGSTGGGIKTNTFIVIVLAVYNSLRGREQVTIFDRRIPHDLVLRALAVILISLGAIIFVSFLLTITEPEQDFIVLLFEATSAFSTVGLSLGATPDLSPAGKMIIVFTMFCGRLGPLTLAFALAQRRRESRVGYPEEKILIG